MFGTLFKTLLCKKKHSVGNIVPTALNGVSSSIGVSNRMATVVKNSFHIPTYT